MNRQFARQFLYECNLSYISYAIKYYGMLDLDFSQIFPMYLHKTNDCHYTQLICLISCKGIKEICVYLLHYFVCVCGCVCVRVCVCGCVWGCVCLYVCLHVCVCMCVCEERRESNCFFYVRKVVQQFPTILRNNQ